MAAWLAIKSTVTLLTNEKHFQITPPSRILAFIDNTHFPPSGSFEEKASLFPAVEKLPGY